MFIQPAMNPNRGSEEVTLPFSSQINPEIQVNSPPAQEIPLSRAGKTAANLVLAAQ